MKTYSNFHKNIYMFCSRLRMALAALLCLLAFSQARAWGETTSYVLDAPAEKYWGTVNNSGTYAFSGPAKTLTFQAQRTTIWGVSSNGNFYAQYSTDGGASWTDAMSIDLPNRSQWYDFTCEIPANANAVRFESRFGATGYKYVRNVRVSRGTTLSPTTQRLDFGTQDMGASKTLTATVSFNNTTYDQQITGTSTDPRFSVTPIGVGATGQTAVSITYRSDTPGNHTATVTLDMNGVSVDIPVSGTSLPLFHFAASAQKIYDHGTVSTQVEPMLRGEVSTTQMQTPATFTAVPHADATFQGWYSDPSHTQLLSADPAYTATLTNSQYGSTASLTLYAWFKKNQTLSWVDEGVNLNLIKGGSVSSAATASSGLAPEYASGNPAVLSVDGSGLVSALEDTGEPITITVSQPGNDEFNAATPLTRTFAIVVLSKEITLSGTDATVTIPDVVYDKVTLQRTLKAGFSTIALPFATTVADLVGPAYDASQDWVAQLSLVTYNARDGYSLYFRQVADGRLEANQPYVLHLGAPVENPVLTDILVLAPKATERMVGDWKMVSNFSPALDMEGRYGVVNADGALKQGAAGSSLNALTAYLVGPSGGQARAHFMDEATGLRQPAWDTPLGRQRYNLMGQRIGRHSRGIVLQRGADGTLRKVVVR